MSIRTVDLFAGPGGWDEGIEPLGIRPLGIEWDESACETRRAAGHETLCANVAELNPDDFRTIDGRAPELLIASPPCQAFSVAGKGDGHKDIPLILEAAKAICEGEDIRAELRPRCADERALLAVEPLRWALVLKPRWIALEQVPPVLSLWEHFGNLLTQHGYECWAGVLSAERYGVPQTRQRAFLLASLDGTPHPPLATHQAYEFGVPAQEQYTLEGTLLPWVSMAEALGWGMHPRPSYTVTAGGGGAGSPEPFAKSAREGMVREYEAGRGMFVQRERSGDRSEEGFDPAAMPSQSLTSKTRSWIVRTNNFTAKNQRGERGRLYERQIDSPSPIVTGQTDQWVFDRPSTTIAGDSRVFQPGGHHEPGQQSQNATRITIEEASILQGFRPDYPWRGSRTKRFEQVGNAVPPPLARAVIEALVQPVALKAVA